MFSPDSLCGLRFFQFSTSRSTKIGPGLDGYTKNKILNVRIYWKNMSFSVENN